MKITNINCLMFFTPTVYNEHICVHILQAFE